MDRFHIDRLSVFCFALSVFIFIVIPASAQTGSDPAAKVLSQLQQQVKDLGEKLASLERSSVDPYKEIGAGIGYNPRAKYYEVPEGFPQVDPRVRFIGNLRGTWKEMGIQYGERAGDLVVNVYRFALDYFKGKGMSEEKLRAYMGRYRQQIELYAPEMIEFMQGIASGVDWSVAGASETKPLDGFERIMLVNSFLDLDFFHPKESLGEGFGPETYVSGLLGNPVTGACTGIALSGKGRGKLLSPTKNGETIVTNHYDLARFVPLVWSIAYVATPSDPKAHVYWSINPAGIVGSQNLSTNVKGVTIGSFFGGQSDDDVYGFGVIHPVLELHALVYANTAQEAVQTMVFGNEAYRKKTGRAKVLQTGLWAYLVADKNEVMVLEVTPNRHAVRHPGDMGEKGNYVIFANWYGAKYYFDEKNVRVEKPIGVQPPEFPERYWTFDWFIKYHFGQLDSDLVKEAQCSMYYFDKDTGQRIDNLEGTALPLFIGMHTISAYWGAALGLDIGGTIHAAQVVHSPGGRTRIDWVQGRPSEWVGPWQTVDFYGYQK
jgi:hypothetical protein